MNRLLSYGMRRGGQDRMGLDEMDWDKMTQYDMICVVDGSRGRWDDGILWV